MGIFLDKVKKIVNKRHEEKANEILDEIKAEVDRVTTAKATGKTRDSFHIMSDTGDVEVSGAFKSGLFGRKIVIGSNLRSAWYLEHGNNQRYSYFGGTNHPAMPNYKGKGKRMLKYDGEIHLSSRTYAGKHPVRNVVERHKR